VGKMWKICGKQSHGKSVEKMWKTITRENYGKFVKRIVWKTITWENCGKIVKKIVEKNSMGIVWKTITCGKSCEKNSGKMWKKEHGESTENI
jgi:hypothetical protein